MKVAIFTDTYPPEINGVATSCRNLYRTLMNHGEDVLVVTTNPYNEEMSLLDGVLRLPGVKMKFLYNYVLAKVYSPAAMKIVSAFHPDVIHIQTDGSIGQFGFLAAGRLHCGIVYTFHTMMEDYTYYATRGYFDRAAKGIVRSYVRHKSRAADEFITPSEKIKNYMRSIGVDAYLSVVPTGIDFRIFEKKNVDKAKVNELKRRYGITSSNKVILSLGRVAKEKSIDICLKGYADFLNKKQDKKTLFVVVGGGPALNELKELANNLGISDRCRFVGPVLPDTVPLYYQLGDIFVSASITETQGLTFMEAMASSIILLARYDDSLLGTIKDGENGFFFLDENDFAEKLQGILTLPAPILKKVEAGAIASIEPYSMEKFYERAKEVYKRAIKKNW